MRFDWPYYTLSASGHLVDEQGNKPFAADSRCGAPIQPRPFKDIWEAEAWLEAMDLRGNVSVA